jgi:general secretion pathway protein D
VLVLQYDPVLLEFIDAQEGDFLKKDGQPTLFEHVFNKSKGRIDLNLSRVGNVKGVNSSGTFASLTFKGVAKGAAKFELSNVNLLPPGASKPLATDLHGSVTEVQ